MLEPIGIATIDLLVCAFIALVVLNLLREGEAQDERKVNGRNPDILVIEAIKACPLNLAIDIDGTTWNPSTTSPYITYVPDSDEKSVRHQVVIRDAASTAKIFLYLFAEQEFDSKQSAWRVRISTLGASLRKSEVDLRQDNAYRATFNVR